MENRYGHVSRTSRRRTVHTRDAHRKYTVYTGPNSIRMSRRALDEIGVNISFYCGLGDGTGAMKEGNPRCARNYLTGSEKKKLRPNDSNTRGNHAAAAFVLCASNEPC